MPDQTANVFVSYSHADASLVAPVVKLLRANKSLVFQDIDSIQPGKKWRSEIAKGLAESDLVIVFWCDHASRSDEVCKEWKTAIEQEKDLLPLLLDATPLPPELVDFQWIDFRAAVGANHASIEVPAGDTYLRELPAPARAKSSRWLSFGGLAAVAAGVVAGILLFTEKSQHLRPLPPVSQQPVPAPAPPMESVPLPRESPPGLLWLALILAVTGCLAWWLLRWHSKRKRPLEITPIRFPDISQIAREIEKEILRRTALKHDAGA